MNSNTLSSVIEASLAALIILFCVIGEGILLFHGLPANVDGVLAGRILGSLDAIMLIVVNYYFGSSRESRRQVEAITAIGQAAANTPINIVTSGGDSVKTTTVAQEQATQATQQSHM